MLAQRRRSTQAQYDGADVKLSWETTVLADVRFAGWPCRFRTEREGLMIRTALLGTSLLFVGASSLAQTPAPPPSAAAPSPRLIGTVVSVTDSAVTVHPETAGSSDVTVAVTPQTRLLRSAPGETSLKTAQPLDLHDLAPGDRVLIRQASGGDVSRPTAALLVAMKQADISQAHQREASDWQRGIAGIVDTVDASSGTVRLKAQSGAPAITVHATASTVVRHYAPASTAFADAHKATLADIHPGDQLRARGQKNDAGDELAAEEIVVGSFRNIAGTVLAINSAANTLSLTDLATKRPVTLQIESGTQLRKLPPEAAARLARRSGAGSDANAGSAPAAPTPTIADASGHTPGAARPHGGDAAALLSRAPSIAAADLHKGDAVMVVASGPEAKQPVAITVIAGVEPLLEAPPEASAGLFSASWNLGGGAPGEEGAPR